MTGHGQAVSQGGCQVSSAPLIVGLLVFLPAGTLDYWQALLFAAGFVGCSLAITVYLAIGDDCRHGRWVPEPVTPRASKTHF
jgi:hypothetical protein